MEPAVPTGAILSMLSRAAVYVRSPLNIELLGGERRRQVLAEEGLAAINPWWVPGDPNSPPIEGVDPQHLTREVDDEAQRRRWTPVHYGLLVFHVYNRSKHAVAFLDAKVETRAVHAGKLPTGRVLQPHAGGGVVPSYILNVILRAKPKESTVKELPTAHLLSTSWQLDPNDSFHLIVKPGVDDEDAEVLDWRLLFHLKVGGKRRRTVRLPGPGPRWTRFRIIAPCTNLINYWPQIEDGEITWARTGDQDGVR